MKIRFLEDTFIRNAPQTNNDPIGYILRSAQIDVEPTPVAGEAIENNRYWYCDKNGWYYWSGKVEVVEYQNPAPEVAPYEDTSKAMPEEPEPLPLFEIPSFINSAALPKNERIPEGETRLVPLLEDLLLAEERFQAMLQAKKPQQGRSRSPEEDSFEVEQPEMPLTSRGMEASDFVPFPVDEPAVPLQESAVAFWQNPPAQQLNWGVRNYLIAQEWWQKRQLTGRGIRLALLSTGIAPDHPDLGKVEGIFQSPEVSNPVADSHGLGTQAAVVAAGTGQKVFGVAPEASLLIAKIGELDYTLTPEALEEGLKWAVNAQADIVAMLVDFPELGAEQAARLQAIISQAASQGTLFLAPVGNSDRKKPELRYPACLEGVFSVGAHDQYGQRSSFSAKSFKLDLLAPGEGLLSASLEGQPVANAKSVAIATAFTAGMLALICQWQRDRGLALSPDVIFGLLRETAASRRSFNKGEDVEYGYGLLNPIAILKRLDETYQGSDGQ